MTSNADSSHGTGLESGLPRANASQLSFMLDAQMAYEVDSQIDEAILWQMQNEPRMKGTINQTSPDGETSFIQYFDFAQGKQRTLHYHSSKVTSEWSTSIREMFRCEPPIHNTLDILQHGIPDISHLVTVFDSDGNARGSIPFIAENGIDSWQILPHTDALRRMHAPLYRNRTEVQLSHLFEVADTYFGPNTRFETEAGLPVTLEKIGKFEQGLHIIELIESCGDDKDAIDAIYRIVGMYSGIGATALDCCDTADEIRAVEKAFSTDFSFTHRVLEDYHVLVRDITSPQKEEIMAYEDPMRSVTFRIGRSLARAALFHQNDSDFSTDMYDQSCRALFETLNEMFGLEGTILGENVDSIFLRAEAEWHETLSSFAEDNASNTQKLGLIEPILERYFLLKLRRIEPGYMKVDRENFYSHILADLNNHSEATGDDEQQLALQNRAFDEGVRIGMFRNGLVQCDHLCGDGERILRKALKHEEEAGATPSVVIGIDKMPFAPADGKWRFIESDLTNPAYLDAIAEILGLESAEAALDYITNMWSGLNDNDPIEQEIMIALASYSLKKAGESNRGGMYFLEVPMGKYIDQMIDIAQNEGLREMGKAILHYPTNNGLLDKRLEIILPHDMIQRLSDAGLKALNVGEEPEVDVPLHYVTTSGVPRMVWIGERIGNPKPSQALADILRTYEKTPREKRLITDAQYIFLQKIFYDKNISLVASAHAD